MKLSFVKKIYAHVTLFFICTLCGDSRSFPPRGIHVLNTRMMRAHLLHHCRCTSFVPSVNYTSVKVLCYNCYKIILLSFTEYKPVTITYLNISAI